MQRELQQPAMRIRNLVPSLQNQARLPPDTSQRLGVSDVELKVLLKPEALSPKA